MINKRQYIILSFFLTRVLFIGGGFSLLIDISKNNFEYIYFTKTKKKEIKNEFMYFNRKDSK